MELNTLLQFLQAINMVYIYYLLYTFSNIYVKMQIASQI